MDSSNGGDSIFVWPVYYEVLMMKVTVDTSYCLNLKLNVGIRDVLLLNVEFHTRSTTWQTQSPPGWQQATRTSRLTGLVVGPHEGQSSLYGLRIDASALHVHEGFPF